MYSPSGSSVNFGVPGRNSLDKMKSPVASFEPGITEIIIVNIV